MRDDIPQTTERPAKSAPECPCEIGSDCTNSACCYYGCIVPSNAHTKLDPGPTPPTREQRLLSADRVAYAARDYLRAERGRAAAQNASDRVDEPGEQREVLAETAWEASCLAAEAHRALMTAVSAWEAAL